MEFIDLIKKRRSIRRFSEENVKKGDLMKILEAVNLAPSAGNLQAYEVVCVTKEETKRKLTEAAFYQHFISEAPVVLVFCANKKRSSQRYGTRGETLYALQDATIACTYAHLAAVEYGLASIWVGAYDDKKVSEIIKAPDYLKPIAILPIGYSAEVVEPTPRRGVENFLYKESF